MKAKTILLAAAMFVMASSVSHGTESTVQMNERVVQYGDLNLNDSADVAKLYRRLTRAAHGVCDLPVPWDTADAFRARQCVPATRARAVSDVNAPELTRYSESRQPKRYLVGKTV